jgi:hypothetical protein
MVRALDFGDRLMGSAQSLRAGLLIAASLCACGPQAPEYRDPLSDLTTASSAAVPADAAVKAGPKVAVTLGSNVERFLKYHDEGNAYAASVGASRQLLEEGNPQYLINGSIDILRRRYPRIISVENLAAAARERVTTTLVVDIQTKAGMFPGDHTTVDLVVIAFDATQRPISRIAARGATEIRPYAPPRIREAHDQALAELAAKANRLLN